MHYVCAACGTAHRLNRAMWRCECGGLLDLSPSQPLTPELIDDTEPGLWRYARALPPVPDPKRILLGETTTPLVYSEALGVRLKLDYLLPTGSFKDRGTAVMMSRLHAQGITEIVEDSSGNAGASVATYAAAAGIACEIFTPAQNSPGKLAQIRATGARLTPVPGDRGAAAAAAVAAAGERFYASHNRQPDFVAGVATVGFELYEQLDRRSPSAVIAPCGQGSVVLGVARAFAALHAGTGVTPPRLFAVQAEAYSAVAQAFTAGLDAPVAGAGRGGTVAEGIATALPIRGRELLTAIRSSGGQAIAVSDDAIRHAAVWLASHGFYVEPTSATAVAGLWELRHRGELAPTDADAVLILTGFGLKAGGAIADMRAAELAAGSGTAVCETTGSF